MRLPLRPPPSATPFSPQAPPFSHAAAPDEAEDDDDDSDYNPEDHPYEPAGSFDAEMDDAKPVSVYELLALRGFRGRCLTPHPHPRPPSPPPRVHAVRHTRSRTPAFPCSHKKGLAPSMANHG